MATATSKRPKAASVKHASLEQTGAFLQALPEKPKEEFSLKEAIAQLQAPIQAALAKGYSYQELAAMLAETGIHISAFTLKNYAPSGKRRSNKEKSAAKSPVRSGSKTKSEQPAVADQSATSSQSTTEKTSRAKTSPTADSTSKPSRGRKTTTAAKTKADTGAKVKQASSGRTSQKSSGTAAQTKSATSSRTTAKSGTSRRGKKTT
jgi:hypothetical protein